MSKNLLNVKTFQTYYNFVILYFSYERMGECLKLGKLEEQNKRTYKINEVNEQKRM